MREERKKFYSPSNFSNRKNIFYDCQGSSTPETVLYEETWGKTLTKFSEELKFKIANS